jgi:hypothetical protein
MIVQGQSVKSQINLVIEFRSAAPVPNDGVENKYSREELPCEPRRLSMLSGAFGHSRRGVTGLARCAEVR